MCRKSSFLFDLLVFFLLIVACQTLYRMHTNSARPFVQLFAIVAKEDTTFIKKELSRFFLYLSNVLKPSQQDVPTPHFLTQLDIISSQLAQAYHVTHQDRYTAQERETYQKEISYLINEVEKTAHDYLKQKSSARLLAPQGLSSQITSIYEDTKKGLALTQQAHDLFETMGLDKKVTQNSITSIEQGLQENEKLLHQLSEK